MMDRDTEIWETETNDGKIKIVRRSRMDGRTMYDYTGPDGVTHTNIGNWMYCLPLLRRDDYQGECPHIFLTVR